MKSLKKKLMHFFSQLKRVLVDNQSNLSYSQEGEDMILDRIFSGSFTGFYVDVGAHHPHRFSNTYKLYKKGWNGLNIEPNPDSHGLFVKDRKRDINLNIGISTQSGTLKYYMFDEPALNTFNPDVVQSRLTNTHYKLLKEVEVSVSTLKRVFDEKISPTTVINFMTIDVEGLDLEVLQSNDWTKYRPEWILVEQLDLKSLEDLDFDIHHLLKSVEYVLFAKTFNTLFYKRKDVDL